MIMKKIRLYSARLRKNEDGATAIEYGLFAALIAAVIAGTVGTLGESVNSTFVKVNESISGVVQTDGDDD